jgi:hypothetical protein
MTLRRVTTQNMAGRQPARTSQPPAPGKDSPAQGMTDDDYTRKLNEVDRLLNDWEVPMQPDRVWRLLDEVAEQSRTRLRGDAADSSVITPPPAVSGPRESAAG